MKAILIDDEISSLDTLKIMLKDCCPELDIVACCLSTAEGLQSIVRHKPDIVFLDIEMPEENGLEFLLRLEKFDFEPIFVTGHSEYARQAFSVSAIDYLLKPVGIIDLKNAVVRATLQRNEQQELGRLRILYDTLQGKTKHIALQSRQRITEYIAITSIVRCQSDGPCTHFHLLDRRKIITGKNLGEYIAILHEHGIQQAHRQHLVAISHVARFHHEDTLLELTNGDKIPLSRGFKESFLKSLHGQL